MTIVGFNFTKVSAERNNAAKGKISINNNVTIKDVQKRDLPFGGSQAGINFNFEYTSNYEPELGTITLNGEVIYMADNKKAKEIIEDWKKSKRVEKELLNQIMNNVLMKCNIQALILSQEINLPPPIMLPKVKVEDGKK